MEKRPSLGVVAIEKRGFRSLSAKVTNFTFIWPIDRTLTSTTTMGRSEVRSNGNQVMLNVHQRLRTGLSPSGAIQCHIQDTRWSGVLPLSKNAVSIFYKPAQLGSCVIYDNNVITGWCTVLSLILLLLESFSHQRQLMVFLWSLRDSKSPGLVSVFWLIAVMQLFGLSLFVLLFPSSSCTNHLVTVVLVLI